MAARVVTHSKLRLLKIPPGEPAHLSASYYQGTGLRIDTSCLFTPPFPRPLPLHVARPQCPNSAEPLLGRVRQHLLHALTDVDTGIRIPGSSLFPSALAPGPGAQELRQQRGSKRKKPTGENQGRTQKKIKNKGKVRGAVGGWGEHPPNLERDGESRWEFTIQSLCGRNRTMQVVYVVSVVFNFEVTNKFKIIDIAVIHYTSVIILYDWYSINCNIACIVYYKMGQKLSFGTSSL